MFTKLKNWYREHLMRGALVEALREDLTALCAVNDELHDLVRTLSNRCIELRNDVELMQGPWWKSMDEELSRKEAEERSDEIHVDVTVDIDKICEEAYEKESTAEAIKEVEDLPF